MEALMTVKVNIREAPNALSKDIGDVFPGDKIYGSVNGPWITITRIHRLAGNIDTLPGGVTGFVAIRNPTNAMEPYAVLKDNPEPEPTSVPTPIPDVRQLTIIVSSDDYTYEPTLSDDGSTITIKMVPRA